MDLLEKLFLSQLGVPYIYGNKNPVAGFDCSGLVEWCLEGVGFIMPGVMNAQSIYNHFLVQGKKSNLQKGALVFFGQSIRSIDHVAWMYNPLVMVECGGGDHTTTNLIEASKRGACVRTRPYTRRGDYLEALMPNYPDWMKNV